MLILIKIRIQMRILTMLYSFLLTISHNRYGTAEYYDMEGWSHTTVGSRQGGIVNPTYPTQSSVPM
jgi:hypothetical protein